MIESMLALSPPPPPPVSFTVVVVAVAVAVIADWVFVFERDSAGRELPVLVLVTMAGTIVLTKREGSCETEREEEREGSTC
jgi:hypothetical protein